MNRDGAGSSRRVKAAIHFEKPDCAPISHAVLPAAQMRYGERLSEILTEFRDDFGWDYMEDIPPCEYPVPYRGGIMVDDFGTVWRGEWTGISGIPVECPIPDLSRYDEYKWPADFAVGPPRGRLYSGHMAGFDDRWYARGAWITCFEQLQQLRGMENLLMDVASESKQFYHLLEDLLAFNLRWIEAWTKLEYDGLHFADDWGGQHSLLINPKTWRRIFKPVYEEMFRKTHEAGMDVWFHTDGHTNEVLCELVEAGADVINCQIAVIGHEWIARNLRGKVAFRTDIDRQHVLPFGTPAEVKEEVQRTFEASGTSEGGVIACGELSPNIPIENIRAMYEAFREYGNYN